jgi:hypothetical protein
MITKPKALGLFAALMLIACCAVCSFATTWWINPVQDLNETQKIVLNEYLAAFCAKDDRHDRQFIFGTMAAMSRIVVKANLGNLALAEYAKCKAAN